MEKWGGNILLTVGFTGGISQWLTDHEPAIQASFYVISIIILLAGFALKIYDRFKK